MKNIVCFLIFITFQLNAQVGIGTTTPAGALDLNPTVATNYGFVAPRVALTSIIVEAPVVNPQGGAIPTGTIVYNTATAGAAPNNVGPGLYYWNGTRWVAFAGSPGGLDWSLVGNSSTVPNAFGSAATNFLGTTDNVDMRVHTNNLERMRFRSDGNIAINNAGNANTKLRITQTGATNDAVGATANDDSTGKGNAFWGTNSNATGIAILGGGGGASVIPTLGAGVSGSHVNGYGIYGFCGNGDPSNNAHNGHAAAAFSLDSDNNSTTSNNSAFAKLAGKDNASPNGVLSAQDILYGGYFEGGVSSASTPSYSYTGIKYRHTNSGGNNGSTTDYKVIGNGTASTLIPDQNNVPRVMFCPEAPEVLFEDYGIGKLENGEAYIKIDEILAKSIIVDEKHPLKVFIQLEGDCNGVFVSEKTIEGFRVIELNNGKSNISFSWHIVANRANSKDISGKTTSEFESLRLPIGPSNLKHTEVTLKKETRN
ncbi:hypothetical protein [Flavobacterium urocaniciphilum]|uniref:Uncharacterized protein n=1 Tax=Flavobacterium urocaniciphilum TaxID=1299341 RepID=A0A1H9AV90_9FLAO|nr:hypothetical protein [Flavobacterium urocaniciphilum]SEP80333.1 hypothetical protein SAMN05444005_102344 [Flavobacterium urocaniciphilum]